MFLSARAKIAFRVMMIIGLAVLYVPLALVLVNAFNKSRTYAFPPTGYTLKWWGRAVHSSGAIDGLRPPGLLVRPAAVHDELSDELAGMRLRFWRPSAPWSTSA